MVPVSAFTHRLRPSSGDRGRCWAPAPPKELEAPLLVRVVRSRLRNEPAAAAGRGQFLLTAAAKDSERIPGCLWMAPTRRRAACGRSRSLLTNQPLAK